MVDKRLILIALSAVILIFSCSSSVLATGDSASSLNALVTSGKHIIILFHSKAEEERTANSSNDGDADFYDDWSNYLESFIKGQGSDVVIYRMSIREARKYFKSNTIPKDEWSIAFLVKGRMVLYSPTPIMEPDIFDFVGKYFEGKEKVKQAKELGLSYLTVLNQ